MSSLKYFWELDIYSFSIYVIIQIDYCFFSSPTVLPRVVLKEFRWRFLNIDLLRVDWWFVTIIFFLFKTHLCRYLQYYMYVLPTFSFVSQQWWNSEWVPISQNPDLCALLSVCLFQGLARKHSQTHTLNLSWASLFSFEKFFFGIIHNLSGMFVLRCL